MLPVFFIDRFTKILAQIFSSWQAKRTPQWSPWLPNFFFNVEAINYSLKTSIKDKRSFLFFHISFIFHLSVFKYNLIKIWRFEHLLLLMFFIMHHCIVDTLPEINFWQKLLPSYLTFAMTNVKIKLLSHFFPNSQGCWYKFFKHWNFCE